MLLIDQAHKSYETAKIVCNLLENALDGASIQGRDITKIMKLLLEVQALLIHGERRGRGDRRERGEA